MTNEDEFSKKYGNLIGQGKTASIYEKDGIVAKVFIKEFPKTEIYHEAHIMTLIEAVGIQSTRVFGIETYLDRFVLKMNKIEGKALDDAFIDGDVTLEEFTDKLVEIETGIHKIHAANLGFMKKKDAFIRNIHWNKKLTDSEKSNLISRINELPDGDSICHGDFHGRNILTDGKNNIIIDWPEVSVGNPAADACRTYFDYKYMVVYDKDNGVDPNMRDTVNKLCGMYLDKYSKASGISKEDILVWLPIIAAALYGHVPNESINREIKSLIK
ncbi:MAG: aminoglycoside phosphotransferase family protein [Methanocorpusculum sp.]|nr:aminoglycoside phosphotransferase family protein [Methanocorpusculum sp.]